MGVISAALTAVLLGLVVAFPLVLLRAKRAPRGRRALRPEPRAGRRVATAPSARAVRYTPKRRAPQPSLAARVAIPTTAAAGTGAAIVLVTASATGAPSSAKAADLPVRITVTAHETISAYPTSGPTATALRIAPKQALQGRDVGAAGSAAAFPDTPKAAPTAGSTAGSTAAPAAPTAAPSSAPSTRPTPAPTQPEPTPEPTPEPEPDEPGLVEGVVGGVGGLVGGVIGPILGG